MKPRITKLFSLMAIFLCLALLPVTAYAEYTSSEESEEIITGEVFANTEEAESEETEVSTSLTPEGNMTLVDDVDSEDSEKMEFITVVSRNGNYFYIIIDHSTDGENTVHFLNQVDEADLMTLMDEDNTQTEDSVAVCICEDKCIAGEVNSACAVCKNDLSQCTGKEVETDSEADTEPEAEEKSSGNIGTIIVVLLLVALGGGGYYYFKVLKPKSKGNSDLDDYDFGDDEDEPEDAQDDDEDFDNDNEDEFERDDDPDNEDNNE